MQTKVDPMNNQVGGEHYRAGRIQPVEYIEANELGFLEGCVVKRLTRHNRDGGKGVQDIDKAIHELQLLKKLRYDAIDDDIVWPLRRRRRYDATEKNCPVTLVEKEWDVDAYALRQGFVIPIGEGCNVHY